MDNKDTDKKKVDPGWNDPPMLNYSPTNPPPKSRITNKRLPFPLNTSNSSPSKSSVPPVSVGPIPLTPSNLPSTIFVVHKTENIKYVNDQFTRTKNNFGKFILTHKDQKTKESIHLMYKLWEEGKFSIACQEGIHKLSEYLAEQEVIKANVVKKLLLSEFKDSCGEWLVNVVI